MAQYRTRVPRRFKPHASKCVIETGRQIAETAHELVQGGGTTWGWEVKWKQAHPEPATCVDHLARNLGELLDLPRFER